MKRLSAEQKQELVRLRMAGTAYARIAAMFGVSEKTVQRTLRASGQADKPAAFYRLPGKKQRLVAAMADGKTAREAAVEAGYSEATARSAGTDLLGPQERLALAEVMRQRLPAELLAQRVHEGVSAEAIEFFAHRGEVCSERRSPDMGERRKYVELAARLRGDLQDAFTVAVPVQVVFEGSKPAWAP